MKISCYSAALIAASILLTCHSAHADLTVKITMLTSASAVKGVRLAPHDAEMEKTLVASENSLPHLEATAYCAGDKIKLVTSTNVAITDLRAHSITTLYPSMKVKTVVRIQANKNRILAANLRDMKTTMKMLGYEVHLYKYYGNGTMATITGYYWVAPGILSPPAFGSSDPALVTLKIPGTALKSSVTMVLHRYHVKVSMVYETTSISTAGIPASIFTIPANYKIAPPPGTPGGPF